MEEEMETVEQEEEQLLKDGEQNQETEDVQEGKLNALQASEQKEEVKLEQIVEALKGLHSEIESESVDADAVDGAEPQGSTDEEGARTNWLTIAAAVCGVLFLAAPCFSQLGCLNVRWGHDTQRSNFVDKGGPSPSQQQAGTSLRAASTASTYSSASSVLVPRYMRRPVRHKQEEAVITAI